MREVRFHVLGPVSVTSRSGLVRMIEGRQPRALLAVLALSPNLVVPVVRLVDLLWDSASDSAANQVRTHKRRLLDQLEAVGLGARLETGSRGGGYLLRAEPAEVDAMAFLELLARASTPGRSPEESVEQLVRAIALWRGRPGDDLPRTRRLTPLCEGLWSRYLHACEELGRLLLGCGRHGEALTVLHRHTSNDPTREQGWALLAAAHYLAGDPGRAQAIVRQACRTIDEELCLEPGPGLKAAEAAIVRQDNEWFGRLLAATPAADGGRSPVWTSGAR